jgi:hypothetical protein
MLKSASTNSKDKHVRDLVNAALFEQRDHRRRRAKVYRAVLTATGQPANGNTVTIGSKVYTFQTVLTNVDGNVFIGATLAISLANLLAAMNLGAGSGTAYAAATTKAPLALGLTSDATHFTAGARRHGMSGNLVKVSTTVAGASWATPFMVPAVAVAVSGALSWGYNGSGGANFTTVPSGKFSANNTVFSLSTQWKFNLTNNLVQDVTAGLAAWLNASTPHTARIDLACAASGATISFFVNSDAGISGGCHLFNTSAISAAGSFNFNDVFVATVTLL